jgi:hypothetical protein
MPMTQTNRMHEMMPYEKAKIIRLPVYANGNYQ